MNPRTYNKIFSQERKGKININHNIDFKLLHFIDSSGYPYQVDNLEQAIKEIGENNVFTSKIINQVSEKDNSENKESQNDNTTKSIIPVPGLSQIVRNEYNLENNKNMNNNINIEENNNKILEPPAISIRDITVSNMSNNKDDSIKESNKNKEEENKKKSQIIFNLLNSNLSDNSNINNNIYNSNNNSLTNNQNSLLKTESNDICSFQLLKNESNNSGTNEIELTYNIHSHPLTKYSLAENICSICLIKKNCQFGYKCDICQLIICDKCVQLINSNYYLHKHKHALDLVRKERFECNICKN